MSVAGSKERIGVVKFDTNDGHERFGEEKISAVQVMVQQVPVRNPAGLILRPVGNVKTYERVGVFQLDAEHRDALSALSRDLIVLV